jgi:hypothetical protein
MLPFLEIKGLLFLINEQQAQNVLTLYNAEAKGNQGQEVRGVKK